ncbi:MAG: aminotransferase class V-fold PLP-dependent enzyme [Blastocatellia bacterium]
MFAGIAQAARKVGALFLLDDYQSCGTRPLDVKATGCDFYVTGTLKYLLAASGIAFLYVRKDLIEQLSPTLTGWFAQRNQFAFDIKHHDPALSANRFQHGTPPIPSIYSSLAGIQVLSEIGLANVEQRIAQLAELFIQKLARMAGNSKPRWIRAGRWWC